MIDQPISPLLRFRRPVLPEIWRDFCFYGGGGEWRIVGQTSSTRRRLMLTCTFSASVAAKRRSFDSAASTPVTVMSAASPGMSPSSLTYSFPRSSSSSRDINKVNSEAALALLHDIRLCRRHNANVSCIRFLLFIF